MERQTGANRCWRNTCSSSKWKNGFVVAQKEELFYAALVKLIKTKVFGNLAKDL
jgi:hypothetical protein